MATQAKTVESRVRNGNGGSAIPWIFGGASLVGAVVVFVWGQINPKVDIGNVEGRLNERVVQLEKRMVEATDALKRDVEEVKRLVDLRLTIAEHREFALRKDKDTDRQDQVIGMLAGTRVNRNEYEKESANVSERVTGLRGIVEKLQADVFGSYNVGKQLDNLQAQQVKQAEITAAQVAELRRAIDLRTPAIVAPNATINHN